MCQSLIDSDMDGNGNKLLTSNFEPGYVCRGEPFIHQFGTKIEVIEGSFHGE